MNTCDDCGLQDTPDEYWSQLDVKPKGISVTLNLCPFCTEKRRPKEPVPKPDPSYEDCRTEYQVTGWLLWASGYATDVHFPSRRSVVVTIKKCDEDRWRVMEIFEDTQEGKRQLNSVLVYIANNYHSQIHECKDHGFDDIACVRWVSRNIFERG